MSDGIRGVKLKNITLGGAVSEREEVHIKAFTKWVNSHLSKAYPPVQIKDLIKDLSDGANWLSLFEVLLDRRIEKSSGQSHLHKIANLQTTLDICKENQIKLDGINTKDMSEGNRKTILGLLWNIIVHFQLKGTLQADSKSYSIEKTLQSWCKKRFAGYKEVKVTDFSTSWRDGKAFNAIIHSYRPDLFDFAQVMRSDTYTRLDHAFTTASLEWNVPRILEPIDVDVEKPDKKMITMYLTCLFEHLESRDKSSEAVTSSEALETTTRHVVTKRTIQVGSVSSDVSKSSKSSRSSSSSSVGPHRDMSLGVDMQTQGQSEDVFSTATTTDLEALPDFSEPRVKHKEMYSLSSISDNENIELSSPELKRCFQPSDTSSPFTTDSDSNSTETVINLGTRENDDIVPWKKFEYKEKHGPENTTITTVKESSPGKTVTTVTREMYTIEKPVVQTRTVTQTFVSGTSREISEISEIDGAPREESRVTVESRDLSTTDDQLGEATSRETRMNTSLQSHENTRVVTYVTKEATKLSEIERLSSIQQSVAIDIESTGSPKRPGESESDIDKISMECDAVLEQSETTLFEKSLSSRNELFESNLLEVERAITDLEGRLKDAELDVANLEELIQGCTSLKLKISGVVSRGRQMIADKNVDEEKEDRYIRRMQALESRIEILITTTKEKLDKANNYKKIFKHELLEMESAVSNMESRIRLSIHQKDNKALIKERDNLSQNVHDTIRLGRSMVKEDIVEKDKAVDYSKRMDDLERQMRLLKGWPILDNTSVLFFSRDREKLLEKKINEAQRILKDIEPRIKSKQISQDDKESLEKERQDIEPEILGIISLGDSMIQYKVVDKKKSNGYEPKIKEIRLKISELMEWPIMYNHNEIDYRKYLDGKLTEVEKLTTDLKQKIISKASPSKEKTLLQERDELEIKVYSVVNLGRGMIQDKFFDEKTENSFKQRMETLEKEMRLLAALQVGSTVNYSTFFEEKMSAVEKAVKLYRVRTTFAEDDKALREELKDLQIQVYTTGSLGRGMIEDQFFDEKTEKEYEQRIKNLEQEVQSWMTEEEYENIGVFDLEKNFDVKLLHAENAFDAIEPRVKKSINNRDNKGLIKERNDLNYDIQNVLSIGRAMISNNRCDPEQAEDYKKRLDKLEKKMQFLMSWPILQHTSLLMGLPIVEQASTRLSVHDRVRFLDKNLEEAERGITTLERKTKKKNLEQDEAEMLIRQREDLGPTVAGVVGLGRGMIEESLVDRNRTEEYLTRFETLEKRMKKLMIWPIIIRASDTDYKSFYEDKLSDMEAALNALEQRVKTTMATAKNKMTLAQESKDFELKVYVVANLGRGMIEDKFFDKKTEVEYDERIQKLENGTVCIVLMTNGRENREKYFEGMLRGIEDKLDDIKVNRGNDVLKEKAAIEQLDQLQVTVNDVYKFYQEMVKFELLDSEEKDQYQTRLDAINRDIALLKDLPNVVEKSTDTLQDFQGMLEDIERGYASIEPRVRKSIHNRDNKVLIIERDNLNRSASDVIRLVRNMADGKVIDKDSTVECQKRMNDVERKMKLLMGWPIIEETSFLMDLPIIEQASTRLNVHDRVRFLDQKLHQAEVGVKGILKLLENRNRQENDDGLLNIYSFENKGLLKLISNEREDLEPRVQGVLGLGQVMLEDNLVDKNRDKEYRQRFKDLEIKIKKLMMWPLIIKSSDEDYSAYYNIKLTETESTVDELLQTIKQPINSTTEQQALMKEREDTEMTVYVVTSLGRGMIEDEFFDDENKDIFERRIVEVETKMTTIMLWPLILKDSDVDYHAYYEESLSEVEDAVRHLEREMINDSEDEGLIKNRELVEIRVYTVTNLGRGMIEDKFFDQEKQREYSKRIQTLERRMKILMFWPLGKQVSTDDGDKYLQDKLREVEKELYEFESLGEQNDLTDDDLKEMSDERNKVTSKAEDVINLGRDMLHSNLVNERKRLTYKRRLDNLDGRVTALKALSYNPRPLRRDFEETLKDAESAVDELEPRVKTAIHNKDNKVLIKQRDDLDQKVQNVISLGREIVDDKPIDKDKAAEWKKRMKVLERRMELVMGWPILEYISRFIGIPVLEKTGELLHLDDREKFFGETLQEAEKAVHYLQERAMEKDLGPDELKELSEERDYCEPKVLGVVGLGRGMITDGLVDKKNKDQYQERLDDLEENMKLLMCCSFGNIHGIHDMFFEGRLREVEDNLWNFEDRLDHEDMDNCPIKDIVNERDDIEKGVYCVVSLGHGMLEDERFSDDKEQEYIDRMDDLQRRMKILLDWPDGAKDRKPLSKKCRDYDAKLRNKEIAVTQFEQRAKVTERESVDLQRAKKSFDNVKALICERDKLEQDVYEVLTEGRILYQEEDMNTIDLAFYTRRMSRLEENIRFLREWLHNEMLRLHNLYIILIKQHLQRLVDWLVRAEVKMDLEDDIGPDHDTVVKQLEEHMEFHKEVGANSTVNMILEIDLDDPSIDSALHQDVKTLSERWAAVWNWSEERKNRLSDVMADWEAFHEMEKKFYDWLVDKDEATEISDIIDISDEEQVDANTAVLKSLVNEIKYHEGLVNDFHEIGEKLISDAQYQYKTAELIRNETNDFCECWKTELNRAKRRKARLQEARKKFVEMANLKKNVNDWLDGTESLIDSFTNERDEQENQTFLSKIEIRCEERDANQKRLEKMNLINKELAPVIEKASAKEINHVIDIVNRRMQDASDKLDMIKEDDIPLTEKECWPIQSLKNCLGEPGPGHVVRY